jgi:predicted lipid carrier protein YhbT
MNWRQRSSHLPSTPSLAGMLSRLPPYPGSWLFARMLNATLAPQLPADVRAALESRKLRLRISNLGIAFDVSWKGKGFAPLVPPPQPDLTIAAALQDLWLLARREEDPDSLFFSRRLCLEGDTELGLMFKNCIDAFDLGAFDLFLRRLPFLPKP